MDPVSNSSAEDSVAGTSAARGTVKSRKKRDTLRVMLLSSTFEVRGSSTQTLVLAENLCNYGVRPTIVTPDARSIAPERRNALNVREYRYLQFPLFNRFVHRLIAQDFQEEPPHLIHIQSRGMLAFGIRLAKLFQKPYLLSVHDYLNKGEILYYDREYGRRIIAVSDSVKSELLTQPAIHGEDVIVIHSGIETIPENKTLTVLTPGRTPVIGMAGPLEQVKGGVYFLEAAQKLLAVKPDVEFLIAGSGPEERRLRQLARQLGIVNKITFVSNLYGFQESLQAIDIFCLPSLKQALGTIMLEAMAWGRPIVATNVGGVHTAIQNGKTGFLVPASNSEALAMELQRLLDNPELAREIGQAGRRHVNMHFRIDQSVGQIADLYRSTHAEFVGKLSAGEDR
ncbi:MAG: glycosyltransferase family 4 protein [Planctomycetaceae bacterium]|nr:glycosyltransferase family 4 protein [Planctomycetaceae bacterium]